LPRQVSLFNFGGTLWVRQVLKWLNQS
jgi:hypothetical protein